MGQSLPHVGRVDAVDEATSNDALSPRTLPSRASAFDHARTEMRQLLPVICHNHTGENIWAKLLFDFTKFENVLIICATTVASKMSLNLLRQPETLLSTWQTNSLSSHTQTSLIAPDFLLPLLPNENDGNVQCTNLQVQEAQLSPRDRAMRRVNWNLANCHATVQKLLIRQVLIKSMVWSWRFSRRQCVIDNVHSTMTPSSRLPLSQVS